MADDKNKNGKKTILIVEDDVFLVKVYQVKLQELGVEVLIAQDGNEALKYLEKDPPDLVLLDIMLPGVSGFDLLKAMRDNPRWKNVAVIILSNLSQTQDIERGQALGIKEYIVKANVRINDVVEKIKKYLN